VLPVVLLKNTWFNQVAGVLLPLFLLFSKPIEIEVARIVNLAWQGKELLQTTKQSFSKQLVGLAS